MQNDKVTKALDQIWLFHQKENYLAEKIIIDKSIEHD